MASDFSDIRLQLCEKRGCWITGEVVDCEVATSVVCRVQFKVDGSTEDNFRVRSIPKDLDLLEKMVKLGRVRTGARVTIFRSEDDSFCPATVLQERLQNRKAFFVQYDDGECEWINLWFHKFEVLEDGPSTKKSRPRSSETLKNESRDATIKKVNSENCSKGLESLKTTNSRELERLTTAPPEEVRDSLDLKVALEGAQHETVDPDLSNERDKVKWSKDKKAGRCTMYEKDAEKSGDLRKDDAEPSHEHDRSSNLKLKRRRDGVSSTKTEDKDENTKLFLAQKNIGSDRARKAGRSEMANAGKLNKEITATGNPTGNEEYFPECGSKTSEIEAHESIPRSTETKPADELNSEQNDIDFAPLKTSGTDSKIKGKRFDSDTMKRGHSKIEDRVTKRLIDGDDKVAVGVRVGIYWEGDKKYYYGKVTKHQKGKKKPFYIEYDDGDSEWVDFSKSTYRFEKKKKLPVTQKGAEKSSPSIDFMVKLNIDKSKADTPLVQPPLRTTRMSMNVADSAVHIGPRRKRSILVDEAPSTKKQRKASTDSYSSDLIAQEVSQIKVGTRVAVWWPDDRRYYEGVVSKKQPEASWRPFFLEYDDGEEEWIDFRQHKFKILSKAAAEERSVSPAGKADNTTSDPSKVWIGTRLSVWWPQEEEYFDGIVTRYRDHKRSFYLEYDDGDREWIDLSEHKFFIVENGSSKGRRTGKRTRSL